MFRKPSVAGFGQKLSTVSGPLSTGAFSPSPQTASPYASRQPSLVPGASRSSFAGSARSSEGSEGRGGRWARLASRLYHALGLGHAIPLLALALYAAASATLFYFIEVGGEAGPGPRRVAGEEANCSAVLGGAKEAVAERVFEITREKGLRRDQAHRYAHEALAWYDEELRLCRRRGLEEELGRAAAAQPLGPAQGMKDFWSCYYYSFTLFSTIGYGTIIPKTQAGKVATMVSSLLGIPLVFFILNDLGDLLLRWLVRVWDGLRRCARCLRGARDPESGRRGAGSAAAEEEEEKQALGRLPMSMAIGVTVAWILACAALFQVWEREWDYFTSFYFFFVSLTTIGLGDTAPTRLDMMIVNFWMILIGLSLVSMCIQVSQAKVECFVQDMVHKHFKMAQQVQMLASIPMMLPGVGGPSGASLMPCAQPAASSLFAPPVQVAEESLDPGWRGVFLGASRRRRLRHQIQKKVRMKVTGSQTETLTLSLGTQTLAEAAVEAEGELGTRLTSQAIQIHRLLARCDELAEALRRAGLPQPGLPPSPDHHPHHHHHRPATYASHTPLREVPRQSSLGDPVRTDPGRELLGQLTASLNHCSQLLDASQHLTSL